MRIEDISLLAYINWVDNCFKGFVSKVFLRGHSFTLYMVYIWYSSQPSQKVFCSKYWCVQLYALRILIFSSAAWLTALDLIFLLMAQLKMLHQPAILGSVDADWRQHRVWVNDVWKTNWNPLENENDFLTIWNTKKSSPS